MCMMMSIAFLRNFLHATACTLSNRPCKVLSVSQSVYIRCRLSCIFTEQRRHYSTLLGPEKLVREPPYCSPLPLTLHLPRTHSRFCVSCTCAGVVLLSRMPEEALERGWPQEAVQGSSTVGWHRERDRHASCHSHAWVERRDVHHLP
jgi:hypothetical protein